jgi:signal transduction histidine kinase
MRLGHRLIRLANRPHLPRRTVRLRLTLLYGALFLASGAALLAVTYVLVSHATAGVSVYQGPNGMQGAVVRSSRQSSRPREARGVSVAQQGGSPTLTPRQLEAQAKRFETLAIQQHADQLHELLVQSGIALAIMAVVSIALGWLVAGRVLRPLRTITTTARTISATNLHERLALDGPDDELKELGDTIDALLMRLETSFGAQRAFVANASHELRTPLARQRAVVQVALADPDATVASLRAAHERVLASGEQQARLIDALLTLTRGQAGLARREPLDLAAITDDALGGRRTDAERRGLHIDTALTAAPTSGDPRLVERLVVNLVDNALRHNTPAGRVQVATMTNDGHAILSIRNDGPIIPPSDVDRIFLPLQRIHPERANHAEGVGLGLSIVQAIASAHHAAVVTSARPEGGLDIEVRFPGCGAERAPLRATPQ